MRVSGIGQQAPLIELDGASVRREGVMVLEDVSLRIELGQHTAILGANGCGKSSFVKLINRELYPLGRDSEDAPPTVRLFGQSRWHVDELRQKLGVVSADLHANLAMLNGLDVEDVVVSGFWASYGIPDHRRVEPGMLERGA
jgi:iron complex transport system ATP-binding protein